MLGTEDLPGPNPNIHEDNKQAFESICDFLCNQNDDETFDEKDVFDKTYKNSDDLVQDYRLRLRALLEFNHDDRPECFRCISCLRRMP